jgi:hypothetical protein
MSIKSWLEILNEDATQKSRRKWEDNIKINFKEIVWKGVD